MFGYVIINREALSEAEFVRFRAHYCGLCHQLREQYGLSGCATLSYDLTFLQLLLTSLYEPKEDRRRELCLLHPLKKHECVLSPVNQYAADMNIAMTWHKCRDNWADEKSLLSLGERKLLDRAYRQVEARYPEKCAFFAQRIDELSEVEKNGDTRIDRPTNLTGQLFGEMFAYKDDLWSETLRSMGEALGRFVYLMDAYEDLPGDLKKHRYNPLIELHERNDYESFMERLLTMTIAECTAEFEKLPLVQDINILRNVLYSGVWSKYAMLKKKKESARKETNA